MVSLPAGMWHFAHSTGMCLPFKGYFEVSCSLSPNSEGFQPSKLWHSAHSPFFGRASTWPLWGSGLWQSLQFVNGICLLKSPLMWHATHETCACLPTMGYFVLE